MEGILLCSICGNEALYAFTLSCSHLICKKCTSRIIFINHLQDMEKSDIVQIKCKCSKAGIFDIDLNLILQTLQDISPKEGKEENVCARHKMQALQYCSVCRKWLCKKCMECHDDLFSQSHQMLEHKTQEYGKCSLHKHNLKEIYCKDCEDYLCYLCCTLKGSKHFDHNYVQVEDYAEKLRQNLNNIQMKFPTCEEFQKYSDTITSNLKKQFDSNYTSTISLIDSLIKEIEIFKANYSKEMKIKMDRNDLVMSILRQLFSNFYFDLHQAKTSSDISLLKYLNEISYELCDIELNYNDQINLEVVNLQMQMEYPRKIKDYANFQYKFSAVYRDFRCMEVLVGHKESVSSLIEMTDGRIISASDLLIEWIHRDSGYTLSQSFTDHSGMIWAVLMLADGRIASGSADKTIKIWTENKCVFTCVSTLTGHTNTVVSLIQLKNGRLASGSVDQSIIIWTEINNHFTCAQILRGHEGIVWSLVELPSGRIASGSRDKTIRIWTEKNDSFACSQTIYGHSESILCIIGLSNCKLASGSADKTIKIWSEIGGSYTCIHTLNHHTNEITSLLQLHDKRIASASRDKTIKIWLETPEGYTCTHSIKDNDGTIISLIELKEMRIAGIVDKVIKIWKESVKSI